MCCGRPWAGEKIQKRVDRYGFLGAFQIKASVLLLVVVVELAVAQGLEN